MQGMPLLNEEGMIDAVTIAPIFESAGNSARNEIYREVILNSVKKILPASFFLGGPPKEEKLTFLKEMLPLFIWSEFDRIPFNLSFFLLSKFRPNAFMFFYEMITRWLVPGKRLNCLLMVASDFRMPELGNDLFTFAEVILQIDNQQDFAAIKRNLPMIETEIRLGVDSIYRAGRILEIKGLSSDEKTALIQENIAYLIQRRPHDFGCNIFEEMQHFLVMCSDKFKAIRDYRHMSRIICVHYLFRKNLRQSVLNAPDRRHMSVKLLNARLRMNGREKPVLGVFVGVNFLRDNEVFDQRHLLKAVRDLIPQVKIVEGSFFANQSRADAIHTLYVEIEKGDGSAFSGEEVRRLRRGLPIDLKGRVEHQMNPIFMPRNEEEIMRHILTLSKQLCYVRDIPQVIIMFDAQTDLELSFTVILLRILKPGSRSIEMMFQEAKSYLRCLPDSTRIVGYLRKKYAKEASVFSLRVPKEGFLRGDYSLDLYSARHDVVLELTRIIGDLRDYNGGMISKQNEVFTALKESLGTIGKHNELLLENFFYSLQPVVMRSVLEPAILKTFFLTLLDALEESFFERGGRYLKRQEDRDFMYVMITANEFACRDQVLRNIERLNISPIQLATVEVEAYDTTCLGLLYRSDDPNKRKNFNAAIEGALEGWRQTEPFCSQH